MFRKVVFSEFFCYAVGIFSSYSLWLFGIDIALSILFLIGIDTICSYVAILVSSKNPYEKLFSCMTRTFKNFLKVEILDVFIIRPIFLFFFIPSLGLIAGEVIGSVFADIVFWTTIYHINSRNRGELA